MTHLPVTLSSIFDRTTGIEIAKDDVIESVNFLIPPEDFSKSSLDSPYGLMVPGGDLHPWACIEACHRLRRSS